MTKNTCPNTEDPVKKSQEVKDTLQETTAEVASLREETKIGLLRMIPKRPLDNKGLCHEHLLAHPNDQKGRDGLKRSVQQIPSTVVEHGKQLVDKHC